MKQRRAALAPRRHRHAGLGKPETLYHLGFRAPLARSTLAEANEQRNWRLWRDLSLGLIAQARRLYAGENLGVEFDNTIYALERVLKVQFVENVS